MNSKIFAGEVMHQRLKPVTHRFDYPVYFFLFDLEELQALSADIAFFGYNQSSLLSLWDQDYLHRGDQPLKQKVQAVLKDFEGANQVVRVELLTSARFFGHVFNPASFFFCYDKQENVKFVIAQVRNTFGEMHLYVLREPLQEKAGRFLRRYVVPKEFHVSPFFDSKGEYEFTFQMQQFYADIHINFIKEGEPALLSRLSGKGKTLTTRALLGMLLRFPLTTLWTLPRIHYQALHLYFRKKLPVIKKPPPKNPMTIRVARPKWIHQLSMMLLDKYLGRIQIGELSLVLPDGSEKKYGKQGTGHNVTMTIHHYDTFWKIVKDAGIGLGEGYVDYDWDTVDVAQLLHLFIENKPYLERKVSIFSEIGDRINRWRHLRRKNRLGKSKKNIQDHYDLGNDFFSLFLDATMSYSCAVYETPEQSLEMAQKNKIRKMIEKAGIQASDHILEIGFGWGGFAIQAVKETGCRVTGITLSEEQLKWAKERVASEGLSSKIELRLCDYREMKGHFDKIISVEMIEAVGHEFIPLFFKSCAKLLKPGGCLVLQGITIPDERYEAYRRSCDWIQKHIFPGGHLPSLGILQKAMSQAGLQLTLSENIGPHYAKTLRDWRHRLLDRAQEMRDLGFPERDLRKWEYYFAYCEAGFEKRYLDNLQMVIHPQDDKSLVKETNLEYAGDNR